MIARVELDDLSQLSVRLGALSDAVLGDPTHLVIVLGTNATHPELLGKFEAWWRRYRPILRFRLRGIVYVVPRWIDRLQCRLYHLLESPQVPWKVVASDAAATEWLRRRGATYSSSDRVLVSRIDSRIGKPIKP